MATTTTSTPTATHTTSARPMPANEDGRANLAGWSLSCSCGWSATTSLDSEATMLQIAHLDWAERQIERHPSEIPGTQEHEDWLIEMERQEEGSIDSRPFDVPGCGCAVSMIYGGDCAHTVAGELPNE